MIAPERCTGSILSFPYKPICICSFSFSFFSCHLTYFLICSSFNPTVLTQYPLLHKCLHQYLFPNLSYLLIANLPFKYPITWNNDDTEYFGGIDTTTCTGSICTFSSNISIKSFSLHSLYISHLTYFPISSFSILYLYFGQNTFLIRKGG